MDIAGKRKRERRKYMKSYTVIANEKKEKRKLPLQSLAASFARRKMNSEVELC